MSSQQVAATAISVQSIRARVLAECRATYGSVIDDRTIEAWVSAVLGSLLTDQTRVTQFVPVLAMREIHERASRHVTSEAV